VARILLVEDDDMNRDMLSRRLGRRGHEVLLASNGAEALAAVLQDEPDLVVLDMNLPVVDGWEVARQLRSSAATRTLPLVALTAHAMAGDRRRALDAGCDEYEVKPVDFDRLLAKISSLLARRS
jgi:CheY-like chemotaxis protein